MKWYLRESRFIFSEMLETYQSVKTSACNSQPWLVKSNGELSVYRYSKPGKRGIMPADKVSFYNRIDIGIFICFIHRFQYQYWTRSSSLHHSIWSESGGWRWKTGNTFFDWQGEKVLNLPLLQTIKWNDFAWFFYFNLLYYQCQAWQHFGNTKSDSPS